MLSHARMTKGVAATVVILLLVCDGVRSGFVVAADDTTPRANADEYKKLLEVTDDKDGLESIRALHEQLDDDNDGTIEPSETGDFIRADLNAGGNRQQQQLRQKNFHKKDSEITVKDLWTTWWRSEVHNWTVHTTIEWLSNSCELPQYAEHFRKHDVTGSKLPLIAIGGSFLNKVVGIPNPIHRSKITLKAMDVVLFGPPKDSSSMLKDVILTTLLVLAVSGFVYAYRQNKRSREHLNRMISDMEALSQTEKTLLDMQDKLNMKDSEIDRLYQNTSVTSDMPDAMEVSRLKEELEMLRHELQRAEVELEDKCWVAPPVLQHWLQLTYEIESSAYNAKRRAAEDQLEIAKDMCERLKKKRSSLVGAFVSTHGRSIDDVDRSIMDAKTALLEVTKDLQERTARWRQIEMLCGCSIMNNAGIAILQNLVRHVGVGRSTRMGGFGASSRMSGSMSQDDLMADDNIDAHSVAASSSHMTSMSMQLRERTSILPSGDRPLPGSSAASISGLSTSSVHKSRRQMLKNMSRESSKESSSSDEQQPERKLVNTISTIQHSPGPASVTGTPPLPSARRVTPKMGPNGRMMVKSYSQDASSNMATMAVAAAAATAVSSTNVALPSATSMTVSVSDTLLSQDKHPTATVTTNVLTSKPPLPQSNSSSMSSVTTMPSSSEAMSTSASQHSLRPPTVEEESYSAASDSGSMASELDASGKKTKKKRSFFNFRRKKEKIP
jgi:stromal interaction molecule 1